MSHGLIVSRDIIILCNLIMGSYKSNEYSLTRILLRNRITRVSLRDSTITRPNHFTRDLIIVHQWSEEEPMGVEDLEYIFKVVGRKACPKCGKMYVQRMGLYLRHLVFCGREVSYLPVCVCDVLISSPIVICVSVCVYVCVYVCVCVCVCVCV